MKRCVVAWVLLAILSCKERGTITVELGLDQCSTATHVLFHALRNKHCLDAACSCTSSCVCMDTTADPCITEPCGGSGCTIDMARSGIEFDPPSAGHYALMYEFIDRSAGGLGTRVGFNCIEVDVDADGTASTTTAPAPTCCP